MHPNSKILHIVGFIDMILAMSISCYVGFQIRQGAELIPGDQLTGTEKIARLVVYSTRKIDMEGGTTFHLPGLYLWPDLLKGTWYSTLIYVFLSIQLYMAIQLLKTTRWIIEEPLKSLRKIKIWLEWSFVYLLFVSLHGATALLLMKPGQRKSIIMAISSVQVFFRIIAIMVVTKYQFLLPDPVSSKA